MVDGEKASAVFDDLASSIAKAVIKFAILSALQAAFGGGAAGQGTGAGGQIGSLLSGMFGGARAQGGPVSPRKVYRVGERGPELFAPRSAGRIIPNGGGAAPELHFHNAPPVASREESRTLAALTFIFRYRR